MSRLPLVELAQVAGLPDAVVQVVRSVEDFHHEAREQHAWEYDRHDETCVQVNDVARALEGEKMSGAARARILTALEIE